jgi:hypothetical protein
MIHRMHLEGSDLIGHRVVCTCGWISRVMGLGDAWTTKERGRGDKSHAAYRGRP